MWQCGALVRMGTWTSVPGDSDDSRLHLLYFPTCCCVIVHVLLVLESREGVSVPTRQQSFLPLARNNDGVMPCPLQLAPWQYHR